MKRLFVALVVASLWLSPALVLGQGPATGVVASAVRQPLVTKSAEAITAAELRNYLSFVASDEMEGRLTPSRGLNTTARFIATMLAQWNVNPSGDDGSYFQRITLRRDKVIAEGTVAETGGTRLEFGKDFLVPAGGAGSVSAAMVFGGDGWFIKARNADPYEGADPKGKVVILTQGRLPAGTTAADISKMKANEDYVTPAVYAQQRGAVGIIYLSALTQANPDVLDRLRRSEEEGGGFSPERLGTTPEKPIPAIIAHTRLAESIFAGERTDSAAILLDYTMGTPTKPFALSAGKSISFTVNRSIEKVVSQNVVGVIEGSDPALKREYVAVGAHYDHLGTVTKPVNGDTIYNGADDDGSGTVALLAMADALTRAPRHPKRSVLFIWHMGEEEGLWGSRYFTMFPTVPLDKVITELNIDMIGRTKAPGDAEPRDQDLSGPDEVYVIGSKMMSTELGAISEAVNDSYLKLKFNYKYDDPKDPQQFFYRSDHINYARKGIPIIFYFTGVHVDYHQLGDEVSKIDFGKYERITRTIYATMWELAEAKTRPPVDKPLAAQETGRYRLPN